MKSLGRSVHGSSGTGDGCSSPQGLCLDVRTRRARCDVILDVLCHFRPVVLVLYERYRLLCANVARWRDVVVGAHRLRQLVHVLCPRVIVQWVALVQIRVFEVFFSRESPSLEPGSGDSLGVCNDEEMWQRRKRYDRLVGFLDDV